MSNKHFKFWHKWLLVSSILYSIVGVAITLFPTIFLFKSYTTYIGSTFFHGELTQEIASFRNFIFAPLGATIAGYFLMQTFIVWGPFYHRETWSWQAIFWPLLLWFVIDSGMSIYHGAFFNVWMINLWTLLLIGLPLMMTRREFKRKI